jgi:hypothetical protein
VLLDSFFDFDDRDNASHADVLCDSNPLLFLSAHNLLVDMQLVLVVGRSSKELKTLFDRDNASHADVL